MSFESVSATRWLAYVGNRAEKLSDQKVAAALGGYQLIPRGGVGEGDCVIHRGSIETDGDFVVSARVTVIDGDLSVGGHLSLHADVFDGDVTLIVFGDVSCTSFENDAGSIAFVTGNLLAREWVFGAVEDSAFVVGGDFRTAVFVGADIWIAVGGDAEFDYGYGYAVDLSFHADAFGAPQIGPKRSWAETRLKLGLGQADEDEAPQVLAYRLYETGTILP